MAVYVDDMRLSADVPNGERVVYGRWSHLMADTEDELRAFARSIGLRQEWIQHPGSPDVHFDATDGKRRLAIAKGAKEITWREAGQMHAERVRSQERCDDIGCLDHAGDDPDAPRPEAPRPAEGRVRHSWGETTTDDGRKVCFREGCGMEAEQRWNPATGRPVVIYSQGDRRLVAERVPPCGSELPDSGLTREEARHLAEAADRKAGEAYKAGDYDRAFRLLTDARVLDPAGFQTWNQHERQLREKVDAQQAVKPAEPVRDDAQIQRETRESVLWNQAVFDRQREASLNVQASRAVPRR